MYPIKWPFERVRNRLRGLLEDEQVHPFEALLVAVSVSDKLARRVLMHLMVLDGRSRKKALKIIQHCPGLAALEEKWPELDPKRRALVDIIGQDDRNLLKEAYDMRSVLVHGEGDPGVRKSGEYAGRLVAVIDRIREQFGRHYGFSGWKGLGRPGVPTG